MNCGSLCFFFILYLKINRKNLIYGLCYDLAGDILLFVAAKDSESHKQLKNILTSHIHGVSIKKSPFEAKLTLSFEN
ncbi:hypothetical protein SAMN05518683_1212 [Salibacterium halotolerans]|uniref:Uncharacterized protein n=1 Tax=Salibacterium halotolerans TaxID=1884432 RepID=A0A1I5WJK5_9BACI|nr:hypothetical protein SAMN05518683_1212 [Salibacterium halotolerans]